MVGDIVNEILRSNDFSASLQETVRTDGNKDLKIAHIVPEEIDWVEWVEERRREIR